MQVSPLRLFLDIAFLAALSEKVVHVQRLKLALESDGMPNADLVQILRLKFAPMAAETVAMNIATNIQCGPQGPNSADFVQLLEDVLRRANALNAIHTTEPFDPFDL